MREVRYGLNGRYATRTATGSVACTNDVFGDPYPGADKICEYAVSSPTAVPAPSPSPSPVVSTQVIEYYGDSTVWGYRTFSGGQVAKPAPAAFADALPAAGKYDVRNEGVSGTTACQLLNGTDGRHPAWDAQMAASKAKYVFINHGINDQWRYDVGTYRYCMQALVQTARRAGKQVILETPNPIGESSNLGAYVQAMRDIAVQENLPVVDQYQYLLGYLRGQSAYTICPDNVHPTDAVYILKGQYAASVFLKLFPAN